MKAFECICMCNLYYCFCKVVETLNGFLNNLRIHWRILTILKTRRKSLWINAFWYVKYVYSESVVNTPYIEIKHLKIFKKIPLDKINGAKNALFFLVRAPTHHGFTFNLRFLNELKHNVCLSKTVCGIFHFRFCFVFIKVYIFVQQNAWTLWL